jgi:hypothetical protein
MVPQTAGALGDMELQGSEGIALISLPFTALLHVQRNVLKDKIIRNFELGGLRRKGSGVIQGKFLVRP